MLGPVSCAPYDVKAEFRLFEVTPIYCGQMYTEDIEYKSTIDYRNPHKEHVRFGGVVESFACSKSIKTAPKELLQVGETKKLLTIPQEVLPINLNLVNGVSSLAPGAYFDSIAINNDVSGSVCSTHDFWSPSNSATANSAPTNSATGNSATANSAPTNSATANSATANSAPTNSAT
jgi:hypothetical protein